MNRTPTYRHLWTALLLLALIAPAPALAQRLIPFQGRVTDGAGVPLNEVARVTFAIYDVPTGGTPLNEWVETHQNVSIVAGQINVLLGSLTSLDDPNANGSMDDAISFSSVMPDGTPVGPRYLGIKVGADSNQEMVPRHQLVPSFHARVADTTVAGGVDTEQLVNGAVTLEKIDTMVIEALEMLVPPGAILPYGGRTAPPGWVLCNGAVYDGTLPEFAAIFAAIGTAFGGSNNMFRVPDLRGQFLRGLDAGAGVDPDFASRTGGEGESKIGSTQPSAVVVQNGLANPTAASTSEAGSHNHRVDNLTRFQTPGGEPFAIDSVVSPSSRNSWVPLAVSTAGNHSHSFTVPSHSVAIIPSFGGTSTETRPTNVAVNYICKL